MKRGTLTAALILMMAGLSPAARGQDIPEDWMAPEPGGLLQGGPGTGRPLGVAPGTLLIHGNYCGVGNNGPGLAPVDALDAACMRHDACTPDEGAPSCDCNARFSLETRGIAQSHHQDPELRYLARIVGSVIPLIACEP